MPNKTSYNSSNARNSSSAYSPICRSETNKIIGGVCGGLGEYFNIDPNIIRLIFILLTVFGGSGIIIYVILWIILPRQSQTSSGKDNMRENLQEVKEKVREFAHDIRDSVKGHNSAKPGNPQDASHPNRNKNFIAYTAILLGILFLLNNFGFSYYFNLDRLWPILLILLGVSIIFRK